MTAGIAATVTRDSDLASHPSVLAYLKFESEAQLRSDTVGINDGQPMVPGTLEFIDVPETGGRGVRIGASYVGNPQGTTPNEKQVAWWIPAEPKLTGLRARAYQRDYGNGYDHVFIRYMIMVEADVLTGAGVLGGKFPGMTGTYDIQSQGIQPPQPFPPQWNPFGTLECRMWFNVPTPAGVIPLGIYYYGTRAPRMFHALGGSGSLTTTTWYPGATTVDTPGVPTSLGQYDGSGTQGGMQMTNCFMRFGVWHCIEQEVKLNTVKNKTFIADYRTDTKGALDFALQNANDDGELRVWFDGDLAYENTRVAFRGEDRIRIQNIPFANIYQGGHGTFPKGPEHYRLAAVVSALQYIGPPKSFINPEPEGDGMEVVDVTFDPTKVDLRINQPTGANPLQAEVDRLNGLLTDANKKIAAQDTWISAAIADATAAKARDDANVEGDSILKRPRP